MAATADVTHQRPRYRKQRWVGSRISITADQPGVAHRMRLPVRMRIHCGIGRFCLSFFASVFLVLSDLLAGLRCRVETASQNRASPGRYAAPPSWRKRASRSRRRRRVTWWTAVATNEGHGAKRYAYLLAV